MAKRSNAPVESTQLSIPGVDVMTVEDAVVFLSEQLRVLERATTATNDALSTLSSVIHGAGIPDDPGNLDFKFGLPVKIMTSFSLVIKL